MTRSHHALGGLSLIYALAAAPASAQDYTRDGVYVGVGVAAGIYRVVEERMLESQGFSGIEATTDLALGFEVFGGYRLNPYLAVEGEFEMLPDADIEISGAGSFGPISSGNIAEIQTWDLTGNVKLYPIPARLQPFLLAGVGIMNSEVEDTAGLGLSESNTAFTARFGAGVELYVSEDVVTYVGANYLLATGSLDGGDYVSFGGGLQYRF